MALPCRCQADFNQSLYFHTLSLKDTTASYQQPCLLAALLVADRLSSSHRTNSQCLLQQLKNGQSSAYTVEHHAAAPLLADDVEARAVVFARLQHQLFFSTCKANCTCQVYSLEFAVFIHPCTSHAAKALSLSTLLLPGAAL